MAIMNIKSEDATSSDDKHSFLINDSFSWKIRQTQARLIMQKRITLCSEYSVIADTNAYAPKQIVVTSNWIYIEKVGYGGTFRERFYHKKHEKHVGCKGKTYVYCQWQHLLNYSLFQS